MGKRVFCPVKIRLLIRATYLSFYISKVVEWGYPPVGLLLSPAFTNSPHLQPRVNTKQAITPYGPSSSGINNTV